MGEIGIRSSLLSAFFAVYSGLPDPIRPLIPLPFRVRFRLPTSDWLVPTYYLVFVMKFTRKTDYALRAMQNLARRYYDEAEGPRAPAAVSVPVLAAESGLSLRFLSGIMARLSRKGLVKAVPGPGGGLRLARAPEGISILEIVEAAEGPINLMECMTHPENCNDASGCSIMGVLHTAQGALVSSLRNTNLKLMVRAKAAPFHELPEGHYLKPRFGCPVLK